MRNSSHFSALSEKALPSQMTWDMTLEELAEKQYKEISQSSEIDWLELQKARQF